MNRLKKTTCLFFVLWVLTLTACTSMPSQESYWIRQREKRDLKEIEQIELLLGKGELAAAKKALDDFQSQKNYSVYYQSSQLIRARIYELKGQAGEAIQIYRDVIGATTKRDPEIATQALYLSSYAYESVGDEIRALAALLDAQKRKSHLTPEQALAELPARLAAAYARMGRTEEAQKWISEAQRGVIQLEAQGSDIHQAVLAKTYFLMGSHSVNQLAASNLKTQMDSLLLLQRFALKSIEKEMEPWSRMASENLKQNYRAIWTLIENYPINQGLDVGAAIRQKTERQVYFVNELFVLIYDLERFRNPRPNSYVGFEAETFAFLAELKDKMSAFINSAGEINLLTPEAELRQGLRQEGLQFIPVTPARPDPNL